MAHHNREHFERAKTFVLNLMSAPGAGKTSLLEKTLERLKSQFTFSVIEGDMVGELDAARLRKIGIAVHQIATGRSCHLDATMVARLLHTEVVEGSDVLFIENVGNLVCPAEFPLGEHKRIVLLSVTEGDDKPIKYPVIFRNCDVVIFTKCDLLKYVEFNLKEAENNIQALNPEVEVFRLSSKNGQGMEAWIKWLVNEIEANQKEKKNKSKKHVHLSTR